ncbi:MAG: 5'-nucleotidase C-terminal domain-containing protein, partial [Firmicutes bacterium]|nr:5'-nucleotidase C-terminal domain-containing protein [Bacillota bacterium]
MKKKSRILAAVLTVCLVTVMMPVISFAAETAGSSGLSDDIVVLYSSDINGGVDANIGLAGMTAYANEMKTRNKYVELVDLGNAVSGSVLASTSKGEYVAEALNAAGYSFAVPGAGEFSYGVLNLVSSLAKTADYQYLSCNFTFTATGQTVLKPYKIVSYGDTKVAYVGISDPDILAEYESYFKNSDGTYAYSFADGNGGNDLYDAVQSAIDKAREEGAQYIIALGSLRDSQDPAYTAKSIIENTSGISAFINSNSGKAISGEQVKTKDGMYALLTAPGEGTKSIGVLTLSAAGKTVSSQLVNSYKLKDIKAKDAIDALTKEYSGNLNEAFATTSSRLAATNGSGVRIVESTETNLGDLAADAYRAVTGADIAFVEASEIKADIAVGGMSYNDVIRAIPGNRNISVVKISGFDLMDALEMSARLYPNRNSGFLQVSGVTFDIQETVIPSVTVDGLGNFVSVDDDYRVTNVMVNGKELDLMGTYTVAGTNDLLDGKTGYTMFKNGPLTKVNAAVDNQAVITYILNNLKGSVGGAYSKSQVRIDSIKLARQSEIDSLVEKKAEEKIKDYKEQLAALQKQVDAQEQIIAVKSLSIDASSKFSKSSSGKRSIKVSWKTSTDVSGIKYQVYRSTKKTS